MGKSHMKSELEKINMSVISYDDCQYCCDDVDMRDYLITDGNLGLYIDGNGNITGDDELELWEKKLNYCPMCGRKF